MSGERERVAAVAANLRSELSGSTQPIVCN